MNSIKELMAIYGYVFAGTCHCDGYLTEKYRKDEFWFRWRKSKSTFQIKKNGRTLVSWNKVVEAEDSLKKLHAQTV